MTTMKFSDTPVGSVFIDRFDVGDTWRKVSETQAEVIYGREFGPNFGEEGQVETIDAAWEVRVQLSTSKPNGSSRLGM